MSSRSIRLVLALLLTSILLPGSVAFPAELTRIGAYPLGPSYAVDLDPARELIFLGAGGAVEILDGSNPADPQLISDNLWTDGLVEDVFFDQSTQRLHIACGEGGFEIWDVQDPLSPQRLSRTEIYYFGVETPVGGVDVYGDYAILECDWGYVHSVDVSDPMNPVQVAFNGFMGNPAHDIYVSPDGQAHSTGADRYQRLRILADGSLSSSGDFDFDFGAGAVFGTQDAVYVANDTHMYIIDLQTFVPRSATNVGGMRDIVVEDGLAYIINSNGFYVWDVTNQSDPHFIGGMPTELGLRRLVVQDGYAYVAAGPAGLRVVEIGDGTDPTEVGSFEAYYVTWETAVVGDNAYLAHSYDGLFVLDVSDVGSPERVGTLDTPGATRDVTAAGDLVYLADWTGGLRIVDASNPDTPLEIGFNDSRNACDVAVSGNYAYVAECIPNEPYWLRVYDVSDPTTPTEVAGLDMQTTIWELDIEGDYLYVANWDRGVRIIDVTAPENPQEVGFYLAPDVLDVKVVGDRAYVGSADWDGGFLILDVSDPSSPQLVSLYNPGGWLRPFDVDVHGDFAYVADPVGVPALILLDISNPQAPVELDEVVPPGDLFSVLAAGPYLFVSDGSAGLQIYRNESAAGVPNAAGPTAGFADFLRSRPNPFLHGTDITFTLRSRSAVTVEIFDPAGRKVRTLLEGTRGPGPVTVAWDGLTDNGHDPGSGVYLVSVSAGGETVHQKLTRLQ